MSESVLTALIAAAPPTLMAMAAWRESRKAKTQVTPSNGKRLGQIVELLDWKLDQHIDDAAAHHRREDQ